MEQANRHEIGYGLTKLEGALYMNTEEPTPPFVYDSKAIERGISVLRVLARYHRHRVNGLEHVPTSGAALIVVNHSLATYDISLLGLRIYQETGRIIRSLGDRAIFKTPVLGSIARQIGVVEGAQDTAASLLEAGELVVVAPGGMLEALRPTTERYQLCWSKRSGFARLSLRTGCPVLLAACPRADDIYRIHASAITKGVYKRFRLPAPVLTGFGPTIIPKPVPLTHWVSKPVHPPGRILEPTGDQIRSFQQVLHRRMEQLMTRALMTS